MASTGSRLVALTGWLLAGLLTGSCRSHACTDAACGDGIRLDLRSADGVWPAGHYQLTIGLDDHPFECPFVIEPTLPPVGNLPITCGTDLSLWLTNELACEDPTYGPCVAVESHYRVQLLNITTNVSPTPATVRLALSRDGSPLLDETTVLTYHQVTPNGPECGPVCRRSEVSVTANLEP